MFRSTYATDINTGVSVSYSHNVDLYQYPFPEYKHIHKLEQSKANHVATIGDLHGNALKFLHFLVIEGILDIEKNQYEQFVRLYLKDTDQITKDDLCNLNMMFASIKSGNTNYLIRLIGDDLADRGSNDYFTLKIFEILDRLNIGFEIILSNHGMMFLEAYETSEIPNIDNIFINSLLNLKRLIKNKLVDPKEISTIIERHYKPNLRIISYGLSDEDNSLILYTHAPVGLETIQAIAATYQLTYNETNSQALINTINLINEKFTIDVNRRLYISRYLKVETDLTRSSLYKICWNREEKEIYLPQKLEDETKITLVHGHNGDVTFKNNMINLDYNNKLGMFSANSGAYISFHSNETISPHFRFQRLRSIGASQQTVADEEGISFGM